eukprot:636207-Rhodomonas_salina.1
MGWQSTQGSALAGPIRAARAARWVAWCTALKCCMASFSVWLLGRSSRVGLPFRAKTVSGDFKGTQNFRRDV